jgi:hypothetical protein
MQVNFHIDALVARLPGRKDVLAEDQLRLCLLSD